MIRKEFGIFCALCYAEPVKIMVGLSAILFLAAGFFPPMLILLLSGLAA